MAAVWTRLIWGAASCFFACIAPAVTRGAEPLPRSVLFLDHNDPGEPFGQGMSAAFRTTISDSGREHIAIYAETLDLIRYSGPRYEETVKTYLREKYRDVPIGVIVAPGTAALRFILHVRAEMWPEAPVIFVSNPEAVGRSGKFFRRHWAGSAAAFTSLREHCASAHAHSKGYCPRRRRAQAGLPTCAL
jgi:hypothetical protein